MQNEQTTTEEQNEKQRRDDFLDELSGQGLEGEIKTDLEDYATLEEIKRYIEDVTQHGGVSGIISRLIYYSDTSKFYDDNEREIEDLIEEFVQEFGHKNRMEFIASLNGVNDVSDMTTEKNLLSWMAYEEIARRILDKLEEFERLN